MTVTTTAEHLIYASGGDDVIRHLSIGGRASVFADVVTGIGQDADSNGIIYLDHTNSWAGSGVQPHMTVDIGTTAGGRDIGSVRLRYNNSTNTRMTIAETAPAELPVALGHHITVREEYLPWSIPKRIVLTRVGGAITAVTEYLDYDLGYPGGANALLAKANITDGLNADGSVKEVRRARWVDGYGTGGEQAFATFTLSAAASVAHNNGATIVAWSWSFTGSGALVGGESFTAQTTSFELDAGFHYISLFVQDSTGNLSPVNQIGVWVHNDAYPPLANFAVTSDETEFGRELQIEFFGDANEADATVIPERSLVCYWEESDYDDGAPGEAYRSESVGWVTDDEPLLKLDDSRYGIKLGATHAWKTKFRANSVTIINTGATPTTWTEMEHMTIDRLIDWSLRAVDTLRNLINVYYTGVTVEVERATLPLGDAWTHLTETAPKAAMAQARCDRYGNLWLRRPYSYLRDNLRSAVNTAFAATGDDWTDADGLTLPTAFVRRAGVVNGSAELWNAGSRVLYASRAPGLRESYGLASIKLPDQFVGAPTPQADLNALAGYHYWHENNPRPSVTLALIGNLDVIEPAWMEPVALTWTETTIRGTQLNAELFIVRRVSVQHANETDATTPPKRITWALEQVTDGAPGETAPVLQMDGATPYDDAPTVSGLLAATNQIAAVNDDGFVYLFADWLTTPVVTRYSLGLGNAPGAFIVDAFSPLYLGTGAAVNGWVATQDGVYQITDIAGVAGGPTVSSVAALALPSGNISMAFERSTPNLGYAVGYLNDGLGGAANGVHVYKTTDGLVWAEVEHDPNYETNATIGAIPGAALSPHTERFLTSWYGSTGGGAVGRGKVTTDGGGSFANSGNPNIATTGTGLAREIHVPFQDDSSAYYTVQGGLTNDFHLYKVVGAGTPVDISPSSGGDTFSAAQAFGVKTCDVDAQTVLLIGVNGSALPDFDWGIWFSRDGGASWTTLVAPASGLTTNFYRAGNIAGDNPIVLFLWGSSGAIGFSSDGATITDKRGNLPTDFPAAGRFLNICGIG